MNWLSPVPPEDLLALHHLLQEVSVSRAAVHLGISQSSMSHRLRDLRDSLGDELLVRTGSHMTLTPRAETLREPLSRALSMLSAVIEAPSKFDPRRFEGSLSVYLPDLLAPCMASITGRLAQEAPRMRVSFRPVNRDLMEHLAVGEDAMALLPAHLADETLLCQKLGTIRWAVAGRKNHPALCKRLTLKRWLEYPHVTVETGNARENVVEAALRQAGKRRQVGVEVPMFLAGLHLLVESDLLMNVPLPVAQDALDQLGLRVLPPPLRLPSIPFVLAWHARVARVPAHEFLRELVAKEVRGSLAKRK